jgi:hypothetical protein
MRPQPGTHFSIAGGMEIPLPTGKTRQGKGV